MCLPCPALPAPPASAFWDTVVARSFGCSALGCQLGLTLWPIHPVQEGELEVPCAAPWHLAPLHQSCH